MTLEQLLIYVVDGGLGVFIYSQLEKAKWFQAILESDYKRWIAAGITALSALLAWGAGVALGFFSLPDATWQSWVIKVVEIALGVFTTFGTSQLAHTRALKATRVELAARRK